MRKEEISDGDIREIRSQLTDMVDPDADPNGEIQPGKGRATVSGRIERESVTGTHGHGGEIDHKEELRR